jgi:hypothetical protein
METNSNNLYQELYSTQMANNGANTQTASLQRIAQAALGPTASATQQTAMASSSTDQRAASAQFQSTIPMSIANPSRRNASRLSEEEKMIVI